MVGASVHCLPGFRNPIGANDRTGLIYVLHWVLVRTTLYRVLYGLYYDSGPMARVFYLYNIFLIFSFSVTNELMHPFLDGFTLEEALERKKLFIIDYKTADGVYSEGSHVSASAFCVE